MVPEKKPWEGHGVVATGPTATVITKHKHKRKHLWGELAWGMPSTTCTQVDRHACASTGSLQGACLSCCHLTFKADPAHHHSSSSLLRSGPPARDSRLQNCAHSLVFDAFDAFDAFDVRPGQHVVCTTKEYLDGRAWNPSSPPADISGALQPHHTHFLSSRFSNKSHILIFPVSLHAQ